MRRSEYLFDATLTCLKRLCLSFVVIDSFGLAKTLDTCERLAFCKLCYAAERSDYQMLLEAFEEMGLVLNREDPMRDMQVRASVRLLHTVTVNNNARLQSPTPKMRYAHYKQN